MPKYEIYQHAGKVPYTKWREEKGILIPIFDKDGTFTSFKELGFIDEVIDGLKEQEMPDIYPDIALVSNNEDPEHVEEFGELLHRKLGVNVLPLASGMIDEDGVPYLSKPKAQMGLIAAKHYGIKPEQTGVIGDRYLTDVRFGYSLGAGAIALCTKVGEGDAKWVPTLRKLESGIVGFDLMTGRAAKVQ